MKTKHTSWSHELESWLPAIMFCCAVSMVSSWWAIYEFDTDEGIELAKGLLVANGFHIYQDIWNDQPPLMSFALAFLERINLGSVEVARTLVLVISCLLLRSLFRICYKAGGEIAAWIAVLLVISYSLYATLSVSIMAGLPAIALALIAIDIVTGKNSTSKNVCAGILFGLSMQVKLFTIVIGPAFFLAIYFANEHENIRLQIRRILETAVTLAMAYLAVIWISDVPVWGQVWEPNFANELRKDYSLWKSLSRLIGFLSTNLLLILVGLAGAGWLILRKSKAACVAAVWFASAFVALLFHTPIWDHHVLLLAVPLAWLGGLMISDIYVSFTGGVTVFQGKRIMFVGLAFIVMTSAVYMREPQGIEDRANKIAFEALARFSKSHSGWVISDRLMDAYRSKLLVPPELAVFSRKRQLAGNLTTDDVLNSIERRKPIQVLLRRFPMNDRVRNFLELKYKRVHNPAGLDHYVLKFAY